MRSSVSYRPGFIFYRWRRDPSIPDRSSPSSRCRVFGRSSSRGRCGRRCRRPARPARESRPSRSRAEARALSARDRTPRPGATACGASATSTRPRASRRSSRAPRDSSRRRSAPARWPHPEPPPRSARRRSTALRRASSFAHLDAVLFHVRLRLAHREFAEVENARGKHGIGFAFEHALRQVLETAGAAGGDHRNADGLGHCARQTDVKACARAIAVHAGKENLASDGVDHALRQLHGVEAGRPATAMREDLPTGAVSLGVDGHRDAVCADEARSLAHEGRVLHGSGIDRHLVRAGIEQPAHILDLAHAATDRERYEHPRSHGLDHVQQDVALVGARGDVEEAELVRALAVVARRDLDGVAGVAQVDKVDALHDPARGDIEARNHALGEWHYLPSALSAAACALFSSSLPSYSARPAIAPMTPSGTSFAPAACTSSTLLSPPEAMIGVLVAWARRSVASMLTPLSMPSRPMSV